MSFTDHASCVQSLPSYIELAAKATEKRDDGLANRMLQVAIQQIESDDSNQQSLIDLMLLTADNNVCDRSYKAAKGWYKKAMDCAERAHGVNTPVAALCALRLTQLCVLESEFDTYQNHFERFCSIYLQMTEAISDQLLDALIDLSWCLSTRNRLSDTRQVNDFISQIRQLRFEQRFDCQPELPSTTIRALP